MRNTLVYLKSSSAVYNSETKFYRWNFMNPIQARKDELITTQVLEAEFPVSYYNVDSTNNEFELVVILEDVDGTGGVFYTETYTKTLTPKQYTASQIASEIDAIADKTHSTLNCSYDNRTGIMTLVVNATAAEPSDAVISVSIGKDCTCRRLIGFSDLQTISGALGQAQLRLIGESVVDLNKTNNVYIETDLLLESRNTNGEKSGILAKIQINRKFLDLVHYQSANTIPIELGRKDTYLDHLDLRMVDDVNESINFNGSNSFSVTLLFSYVKKDKLLLGDEIVSEDILPIIDNINTGDSCDEYSDNEVDMDMD